MKMRNERLQAFAEARINGGQVTVFDPSDLQNNQFKEVTNYVVRKDKTTVRNGLETFPITKPDSEPIVALYTARNFDGDHALVRFTRNSCYTYSFTGTWVLVPPTFALTGTADDAIRVVFTDGRAFFTNNGKDEVQELVFDFPAHFPCGDAQKFKYICTFGNRLVCAYQTDNSAAYPVGPTGAQPTLVAWSADNDFDVFNPSTDITAGWDFLHDNASDRQDFITGLFGFASAMVILKERSIWLATKQAIGAQPFYFYTAVPSIGCDIPNSAVAIPNGICWVDKYTRQAYAWTIGSQTPVPFGTAVIEELVGDLWDADKVSACYDPKQNEYRIATPSGGETMLYVWVYNFETQAWRKEIYTTTSASKRICLYNQAGLIGYDPYFVVTQADGNFAYESNIATDVGASVDAILISKTYELPVVESYVSELKLRVKVRSVSGSMTVYYSRDNGDSWAAYKTINFVGADQGTVKTLTFPKNITCKSYTWKIESTDTLYELLNYEIHVYSGAQVHGDNT